MTIKKPITANGLVIPTAEPIDHLLTYGDILAIAKQLHSMHDQGAK